MNNDDSREKDKITKSSLRESSVGKEVKTAYKTVRKEGIQDSDKIQNEDYSITKTEMQVKSSSSSGQQEVVEDHRSSSKAASSDKFEYYYVMRPFVLSPNHIKLENKPCSSRSTAEQYWFHWKESINQALMNYQDFHFSPCPEGTTNVVSNDSKY